MLHFSRVELTEKIGRLPIEIRVAFATACSERMLPGYTKNHARTQWGDPRLLEEILDRLWRDLLGEPMPEIEIEGKLLTCLTLTPGQDDPCVRETPAAQSAASGIAHALMCRLTGSAQEAADSAWSSHENVWFYVGFDRKVDLNDSAAVERIVVGSPLVQAELARQNRDYEELQRGDISIGQLRERSKAEAATYFPLL